MSLSAVVVWVSRRSCQLVDLEETKTVFPVQMLEYKGNHSALSGWTGSKIKDHDLVRLNNPNFLMHLFAFVLCIFFMTSCRAGHAMTYFSMPAGGELAFVPPWWISGVLPLVKAHTASTGCSSQAQHLSCNTWESLFVWYTTFPDCQAHMKTFKEPKSQEELVLMSAVQGWAWWLN